MHTRGRRGFGRARDDIREFVLSGGRVSVCTCFADDTYWAFRLIETCQAIGNHRSDGIIAPSVIITLSSVFEARMYIYSTSYVHRLQ